MPFDLIHRYSPQDQALSFEEIRQTCPAAFADSPDPELSARYGFVSTADAIRIACDHGFEPVRAIQKPVRKAEELPFADHMISLRALTGFRDETETAPEIVIYNSHNGRSSLKVFAGFWRFICSNNAQCGEGFQAKLRHSRLTASGFSDMIAEQAANLPGMMENIERMRQTAWDRDQTLNFIQNAVSLRWEMDPDEAGNDEPIRGAYATRLTLQNLNQTRRWGDNGPDAWKTFNRVQESLIRGGVRIKSYTDRKPYGMHRWAKGVQSLSESVRINRSLWDLAHA